MEYYLDTLVRGAKRVQVLFVESSDRERSRFVEKLIWERQKRESEPGAETLCPDGPNTGRPPARPGLPDGESARGRRVPARLHLFGDGPGRLPGLPPAFLLRLCPGPPGEGGGRRADGAEGYRHLHPLHPGGILQAARRPNPKGERPEPGADRRPGGPEVRGRVRREAVRERLPDGPPGQAASRGIHLRPPGPARP